MTKTSKACLGKLFAELLEISGAKPWGCGEVVDLLLLYCDVIGEVLNLELRTNALELLVGTFRQWICFNDG